MVFRRVLLLIIIIVNQLTMVEIGVKHNYHPLIDICLLVRDKMSISNQLPISFFLDVSNHVSV